jgi:hypothetical protein
MQRRALILSGIGAAVAGPALAAPADSSDQNASIPSGAPRTLPPDIVPRVYQPSSVAGLHPVPKTPS